MLGINQPGAKTSRIPFSSVHRVVCAPISSSLVGYTAPSIISHHIASVQIEREGGKGEEGGGRREEGGPYPFWLKSSDRFHYASFVGCKLTLIRLQVLD